VARDYNLTITIRPKPANMLAQSLREMGERVGAISKELIAKAARDADKKDREEVDPMRQIEELKRQAAQDQATRIALEARIATLSKEVDRLHRRVRDKDAELAQHRRPWPVLRGENDV